MRSTDELLPSREISPSELRTLELEWKQHQATTLAPDQIEGLARRALELGDCLLAREILATADSYFAECPSLHFLDARILVQMGNTASARGKLLSLIQAGQGTCDILSLMGRSYKDDWQAGGGEKALKAAIGWYARAYRGFLRSSPLTVSFPAVNVASLCLLGGQNSRAHTWARCVLDLSVGVQPDSTQKPWQSATLGEAYLCLGDWEAARQHYTNTKELSLRSRASARRQARLLLRHLGRPIDEFDACFNLPTVAVFAGHMIDDPQRAQPRFPATLENRVAIEITRVLAECQAGFGYSSAAAGSDILFAEAMLHRAGELHIQLSGPKEDFVLRSVAYLADGRWLERFEEVVRRSTNHVDRSPDHQPQDQSLGYIFANRRLCGMAAMRADTLGLDLAPISVYDGSADGEGGTCDFVQFWNDYLGRRSRQNRPGQLLIKPIQIDLAKLRLEKGGTPIEPIPVPALSKHRGFRVHGMEQAIKAMLFADVSHFSRLSEEQLPAFFRHYMGGLSDLINTSLHSPIVAETWGDAVFMVFDEVEQAGSFALEMQDTLSPPPSGRAHWASYGLAEELAIRIALHAGPVFSLVDRITRRISFTGRHVSQAARLESLAQPGEIFVTESFAALAWAEQVQEFNCEFIGTKALPKDYGDVRVFRLHGKPRSVSK